MSALHPAPGTTGRIPESFIKLCRLSHPKPPITLEALGPVIPQCWQRLPIPSVVMHRWLKPAGPVGFCLHLSASCSPPLLCTQNALSMSQLQLHQQLGYPSTDHHRSAHGRARFWGGMCILLTPWLLVRQQLLLPTLLPSCGLMGSEPAIPGCRSSPCAVQGIARAWLSAWKIMIPTSKGRRPQ